MNGEDPDPPARRHDQYDGVLVPLIFLVRNAGSPPDPELPTHRQ